MAAFSRLQLAAALLEYDNDPSDPDAPHRSAHDSAIFAHLRRNVRPLPVRKSDYLGVSLPSESGSLGGRESALDQRRSRGSIEALRNPFGADTVEGHEEEDGGENDMEVDLTSWGLDAFMPKDKESRHNRNKSNAKMEVLPNPHPVSLRRPDDTSLEAIGRRVAGARSMSLGNMDQFGTGGAFLETRPTIDDRRRRSFGSPLDLHRMEQFHMPRQGRRASSHALIETLPTAVPLHSIPFPSGPDLTSSHVDENDHSGLRPSSGSSRLNPHLRSHERTYSTATMGSRVLANEEDSNPFSVRPPSPERASRFDPKSNHPRTTSNATMATLASPALLVQRDDSFSLPPSRMSVFDPKAVAHARTTSNASMGSRILLENDHGSTITGHRSARDRPYSTLELLRPKVLVMPSPLQAVTPTAPPQPIKPRAGFQISADGPPLPPGARSNRRSSVAISTVEPSSIPIASNSFTPNPRLSLSLSQLTFRNTLMVGGQRDVAYSDIDGVLPRATQDGEQIQLESPIEDMEPPIPEPVAVEEPSNTGRRAGKLFGRSLIDDLEERKARIHGKQRVFTGDERPSMMVRGSMQSSSRLVEPTSLQSRPKSQHMNSLGSSHSKQALGRRISSSVKPLLNFDDDNRLSTANLTPDSKIPNSRSVFGVDTLWEREMAKLQEIEALEKQEAEAARQREIAVEAQRNKRGIKGKGKAKLKSKSKAGSQDPSQPTETIAQVTRVSEDPPVLPSIPKATVRRPPPAKDDLSESDESLVKTQPIPGQAGIDVPAERWLSESSDDGDNAPRRTTGKGPRYPNPSRGRPTDDDSEEDIPLAAAVGRAVQRATRLDDLRADSDEEKPLSALLEKTKLSLPPIDFDRHSDLNLRGADDDDDQPLGLRASKMITSSQTLTRLHGGDDDDDDRPLAFHPEQQRRTQYQMMVQQQQQQMMLQANSMFFGAPSSMMGSGFFAPSIQVPMMVAPPPPPMPSPPPVHDAAKYGRVDRWRRDVVVEGEP